MIPAIVIVVMALWVAVFAPPTFKARFEPAIHHPLHSVSAVRPGFCYPAKCVVG